ncbi:MAG: glycosyltransferase [Cyanothece sp. SIO1E1]|nr:glycosyltransferase [Cyanothece sp. SIO1E1]
MHVIGLGLTVLSLVIWVGLICFRGQFWRADQRLEPNANATHASTPDPGATVCAIIPARNEADLLPTTLRSLLTQDYPGHFSIILVDDHSTDGTARVAQQTALELNQAEQLEVLAAQPLPAGWTGKLWALEQGTQYAQHRTPPPDYLLLTDADIEHDQANLNQLVTKAEQENLDLVSLMVRLRCQGVWEYLLIPAFVFFFQKLYPFPWVNQPQRSTAAAAGGCILIRRQALARIGGIQVVRQALIDDCALAQAVKQRDGEGGGKIWLGLTDSTRSLRPYPSLASIWDMVARTAYTQLEYSPLLLVGALMGMILVYLVAPIALVWAGLSGSVGMAIAALATWGLMALAYWPTLRLYQCAPGLAFCLPAIAFLYTLMTLDSALRHWRGQGGEWKGRVYSE